MFELLEGRGWSVKEINHGKTIAEQCFSDQCENIIKILSNWSLNLENHIIKGGGGQADHTQELTKSFESMGWEKNRITVKNIVSFERRFKEISINSSSHEVDHLIHGNSDSLLALEIEWNNKDEFFDRDFQTMHRWYDLEIIDLAIIITRGPELEDQLEQLIANYFIQEEISDVSGFDKIKKRFTDSQGNARFSFPTVPQQKRISKLSNRCSYANAAAKVFKSDKFGAATTNWKKLNERIERKHAGRTPMLFFGIPLIS